MKLPGTTCSVGAALTRDAFELMALGIEKVARIERRQIAPARPQVSFSMKLFVRRTPIIWLEPAKVDERPPPFDF